MDYVLEIKTVQSQAFKILIEALKELLTDTCIEFDETGMKIISTDTSCCVLVHLKLKAANFEYFMCKSKIVIGVNMLNLYKLIRTINSNDTLTLYIEENDPNHLAIKIENGEKNSKTTYKLNLLDMDNPNISADTVEFNSVITLPSVDFQKFARDMHNIAENIEIKNVGNQLLLNCVGDFCSQETVIMDNDNGINTITTNKKINNKNCEIVQGVFSLKYLVLFSKCTGLSSTVELLLKNDYPLVIRYMVASLGEVKFCISPKFND